MPIDATLEISRDNRRWIVCTALLALSCLGACKTDGSGDSAQAAGFERSVLRYEGSTNTVSIPELAEDLGFLAPLKLEYIGNNATGGPHSIQSVVTGDLDFGSSFNGPIIKMVAAKAPLRAVVSGYGTDDKTFSGFYVLESSTVRGPRDLIGKKVAMNTLGAHSEFVLREYLARGGLSQDEINSVTLVVLPPINAEQALRNKQIDAAAISVMLRDKARARGPLKMLFSDYELFGSFNAGSVVMSTRFTADNPKTARKFVQAVGAALDWAHEHPREEVIARMQNIIRKRGRNENTETVHHWQSTGVSTPHGLLTDRDYQLWIDWMERAGQLQPGQIKPSDVYTNEFNVHDNAQDHAAR
jgi:ABC-type nitrate/sulfonate/bicarbonate transport system substrate-binding protein